MRFASLGSGSSGNALLVSTQKTTLLIDNGFSKKETERRLCALKADAASISAILLTHEHSDHASGAVKFAQAYQIPLFLTYGSALALMKQIGDFPLIHRIDSHEAFVIDDLEITPYPVPHDARGPVQYVFTEGKNRLGLLTDAGMITPYMIEMLNACDALVLECNHDTERLLKSAYPASLKKRITSNFGHLSNAQAALFLSQINTSGLQHLIAAHLSAENNTPELVALALAQVLSCKSEEINIATQKEGFSWRSL